MRLLRVDSQNRPGKLAQRQDGLRLLVGAIVWEASDASNDANQRAASCERIAFSEVSHWPNLVVFQFEIRHTQNSCDAQTSPTAINNPSASAVNTPFADAVSRVKIFRPSTRSTTPSNTRSVNSGVGMR